MVAKFDVKLTQKMELYKYPFDRQILDVTLNIRGTKWKALPTAPDWLDTGYLTDRIPCTSNLSEAICHYDILTPWVDAREMDETNHPREDKDKTHTVYLRLERKYQYELRKIVFPLFIIVVMAMASLGLEPDKTDARIAAPTGMMLATIGFQYVILETMPKNPQATRLDHYVTFCMLLILMVVAETLFVKQYLEGWRWADAKLVPSPPPPGSPAPEPEPEPTVTTMLGESTSKINKQSREYVAMEWLDFGSVVIAVVLWIIPHILLFWLPKKYVQSALQNSWADVLHFIDTQCKEQKKESSEDDVLTNQVGLDSWSTRGPEDLGKMSRANRRSMARPARSKTRDGGNFQRTRTVPNLGGEGTSRSTPRLVAPDTAAPSGAGTQRRAPLGKARSDTKMFHLKSNADLAVDDSTTVIIDEYLQEQLPEQLPGSTSLSNRGP
jgi:hypothetical protein